MCVDLIHMPRKCKSLNNRSSTVSVILLSKVPQAWNQLVRYPVETHIIPSLPVDK